MKRSTIVLLIIFFAILVLYLYPTPRHSFVELYKGEDYNIVTSLDSFRRLPLNLVEIEGQQWKYLSIGRGDESILFLHGMAGGYDIWWQQILSLKDRYRIITLTYPPVNSLQMMGEAVMQILDKEKISETHVIGSSLGGYFTQYLKATYPVRIKKVVFGNTFPPNEMYKERNGTRVAIAKYLPEWLVMYVFRESVKKNVVPTSENSAVVAAYLLEQSYGGMSKAQFLARYYCVVDKFSPTESLTSHDMMIIESDNDPLIFPELRAQLRSLYPHANVLTYHNQGHFPYLTQPDNYRMEVEDFLSQ